MDEETALCEWCGAVVNRLDQQCYARDDGWTCDPAPYESR